MALMTTIEVAPDERVDQRVTLRGARWEDYERLLKMRGESSAVRITFLEGVSELMGPSVLPDGVGTTNGWLVETDAVARGIALNGYGSWTIRKKRRRGGLEPDKCYVLGNESKKRPDLAVEVVATSGGIDKLEVYCKLEVPEVWFWHAG